MASPNSYSDPYWSDLASKTGDKLGLPTGLLPAIVTKGERTNANQVSEVGAKTPFQITPGTRKAAIDKYGIDPYLSDDNAAEVAGRLLKDSLDRNKGNVAVAVSEYHGGTDKANWGPKTRAYVARVVGGTPELHQPAEAPTSTFQRALAAMPQSQQNTNGIAQVYDAYKSGKMSPDDAKQFEDDVKSGLVMLPRGAALAGQTAPSPSGKAEAIMLPLSVTEAYQQPEQFGGMNAQDRAQLEKDIKAGLVKLPPTDLQKYDDERGLKTNPPTEYVTADQLNQREQKDQQSQHTLGQKIVGGGEAALTTITGLTGGTFGQVIGNADQLVRNAVNGTYGSFGGAQAMEDTGNRGAGYFTYQPRTESGQEYAQDVGDALHAVMPIMPMTAELGMAGQAVKNAVPAVNAATRLAAEPIVAGGGRAAQAVKSTAMDAVNAVKSAPGRVAEAVGLREPVPVEATPQGRGSAGASAVPADVVRAAKAAELPVPIKLTKGAETRDAAQLAFEKEQMKGEHGAPLRARAEENNLQALQNFDTLIDSTESQLADVGPSAVGGRVTATLAEGYKKAKNQTRAAYTEAAKSPEAQAIVDTNQPVKIGSGDMEINDSLVGYLNKKPKGVPSSVVPDAARKILIQMGLATEDEGGNLVGKPSTIAQMEEFRKELSGTAKFDDPVGVRNETIIKKLTDATTDPASGPLYKAARALRTQQAMKYENRAVVARLLKNRKGMDDPTVAADQVFNKSIANASPEEITFLKRVILTSGEDGPQTWKELQGATLKHIKDESSKGMGMDAADNPLISPAKLHQTVTALDKNGRLDIVLGKKNAAVVRDLNDVVRYINTVPPGTLVNSSGTVGTLLAAIGEAGATGALTGLPVPALSILRALSKQISSNKMKLKINHALNLKESPSSTGGTF